MSGKVLMDSGEEYVKEDKVEFTDIAVTLQSDISCCTASVLWRCHRQV